MSKKIYQIVILIIIILASCLRFVGINPSYPPYHPDEGISYSTAVSMIKNGSLDPLRYDYPAVVPLTNYLFFKTFFIPANWLGFYLSHLDQIISGNIRIPLEDKQYQRIFQQDILGVREINALFWGRYVTAAVGVGVVILTLLLALKLFNRETAVAAAFLTAINFRQVLNSHLGLPDIYNSFFLLAATLSAIYLWKNATKKRYLLTAVLIAISFSTKYQLFALAPFILVHLYLTYLQKGWQSRLKYLFRWEVLLAPLLIILIFIILNPYHIIKYKETLDQVYNVSLKYGVGHMSFYLYPYAYLYHIGIGMLTSWLIFAGFIIGVWKYFRKAMLLLLIILPFFFVTTYYSTGGFYTRNFVTITPFLLIFAGLFLSKLWTLRINRIVFFIFLGFLILATRENLVNSSVVAQEYIKPWNYKIISSWIKKNIPKGSNVSAHPAVPLPDYDVNRSPYDFEENFSIDEFREAQADYAVATLDMATNQFYGWMSQAGQPYQDFNKPTEKLEQTFAGMALRELSDSAIYSVLNPWQAPDSDFIVAKIPNYQVIDQIKEIFYTFEVDTQGWQIFGLPQGRKVELKRGSDGLVIGSEAAGMDTIRWQSPPIKVEGWSGFLVESDIKTEPQSDKILAGFLVAAFYETENDALTSQNRVGVRVGKRTDQKGWLKTFLVGVVPQQAKYLNLEFRNYDAANTTVYLNNLTLFRADVKVDYKGVKLDPVYLDDNILFPNSHGNL